MNRKVLFSGFLGLLALSTVVTTLPLGRGPASTSANAQAMREETPVKIIPDVFIGDPNAPVTVIEYASFTCVHCGDFANNVFPSLKSEFIDTGKVKFALREVYTDKFGLWAGLLAYEASDGRADPKAYYTMVHDLYQAQGDWSFGSENEQDMGDKLRKIAVENGVSLTNAEQVLTNQDVVQSLAETFTFHAGQDGINATPTFIINGDVYPNMPLEDFRKTLDSYAEQKE